MFEIKDFKPRLYQEEIFEASKEKNILVCLPTGTGKTFNILLLALYRLNKIKDSKIAVASPTKPLNAQHVKTFKDYTNINHDDIVLLTGAIKPEKRKELYNQKVIIATPQTLREDLMNNRFSFKNFSLLAIDEAHRAIGQYAYTYLAQQYLQHSEFPRILALTASPGSTKQKIDEICKNLFIEAVEIRTENDIQEYIQKKDIQWITVELPEQYKKIINLINNVYKEKLKHLQSYGILKPISVINKKDLLLFQKDFQRRIKERDKIAYSGVSLVAQLLKLNHAIELIETQGPNSLKQFIGKIQKENSKASLVIKKNPNIIKACELLNKTNLIHPKLKKLIEILINKFKLNKNLMVIVFSNYRNTVRDIVNELNKIEDIKAVELLGQKEGITQKKQIETIKNFEDGIYNVLVCSNIGEEGLSIKGSSLCVFFDHVYGLRRIQRTGRVARTMPGEILFLITKGTRDEAMYWKSRKDISKMTYLLKKMQNKSEEQSKLV